MKKAFRITPKFPGATWEEEVMIKIEKEDNLIEFAVRFYKLIKDNKVARLEMFADALIAFKYDIDFFKDLANYQMTSIEDSKLTKDTLINLLLRHGYTGEQDD